VNGTCEYRVWKDDKGQSFEDVVKRIVLNVIISERLGAKDRVCVTVRDFDGVFYAYPYTNILRFDWSVFNYEGDRVYIKFIKFE
jgi:hypothetical protein